VGFEMQDEKRSEDRKSVKMPEDDSDIAVVVCDSVGNPFEKDLLEG